MSLYKDLYPDAYPDWTPDDDEYELVLQATGALAPVTLWDAAQATIAEQRYVRACLDGQLRRGAHTLAYGGDDS